MIGFVCDNNYYSKRLLFYPFRYISMKSRTSPLGLKAGHSHVMVAGSRFEISNCCERYMYVTVQSFHSQCDVVGVGGG